MSAPEYRGDPLTRPRIAHRPPAGPLADRAGPFPGWHALGAYLAGTGPRPELPEVGDPAPFVRCSGCHGWHRLDVSHR